ncbi:DNA adenine methylase [Natronomonas salina]|uniref:DNA adenine methylase n=1 Tax=Natronomonas salina TaxID=1710540 RepID=UPI0015B4AD94|nr:DNA adenine methylase [Natronomonas salina]QLD89113.1 DNA adenine methylase [Natronomonas salina]
MANRLQPFPWYGGKYKWLDFLLPKLPHRKRYVEPFGGSATVLLNREPAPIEAFNDLDEYVMTFFEVLRDNPEELINSLQKTPYHESEFEQAVDTDPSEVDNIELARRFWLSSTMAYNSAAGSGSFSYSTTQSRRDMAQHTSRFKSKIEHLEAVADRLQRVQFFNRDALDVIERFDRQDTIMYLDPPYPLGTRGGSAYRHEMAAEEHKALLDVLHDCAADVAISTYQSDLYDSLLLGGWKRLESAEKKTAASNSNQGRVESLYVNYEIPSEGFENPETPVQAGVEQFTET